MENEEVLKRIKTGCVFEYFYDYYRFAGYLFERFDEDDSYWVRDLDICEMLFKDLLNGRKLQVKFIENWREVKKGLTGESE